MLVRRGCVVSHSVATEWGVGKVIEVNDIKATIQFNDGITRKIIASHFADLQPANPASYVPPSNVPEAKATPVSGARKTRKTKEFAP